MLLHYCNGFLFNSVNFISNKLLPPKPDVFRTCSVPIHKLRAVDQKGSYTCWSWKKTNIAFLLTKDENWYAHDNDMFRSYVLTVSRTVSHADIAKLIGSIFMKLEGSLQFSQEPAISRILDQVNLVLLQYHLAAEH
jgi:hypothetical protein